MGDWFNLHSSYLSEVKIRRKYFFNNTYNFTLHCNIYDTAYSEGWDNGNPSTSDGCTYAWTVVPGWDCLSSIDGQPSTWITIWGDGKRISLEVCDDGNMLDNMGWKSDCSGSIDGWYWDGGSSTSKDIWTEQCNDGFITTSEQCEDGGKIDGDGWSSSCQIETGWNWINNPAMTSSVWNTVWGDGILVVGHELWDDGNSSDNQGCKPDWSGSHNGWHCIGGSLTTSSIWSEQCGDGYVTTHEQWDDGNSINSDGWSSNWLIENGWQWAQDSLKTRSYWTSLWGNGILDKGEDWDDGNKIDNDGWSSLCKYEACNTESLTWKLTPTKTEKIFGTWIQFLIAVALILNLITSIIFGKSLNDFWLFLNVLQILHYLPMFTLYFPLNVFKMFSFIGIVNFENPYFSEVYLYHINQDDLSFKNSLNYRVENQGYDSTSILINCSDLLFSFILLIIYYLWIVIISLVLRPPYDSTDKNIWKSIYNKLHKSVKDKRSNLFFNSIIRILFEVFLDLLFWWSLNLYDLTFRNFTDIYSSLVALFCTCILIAFTLFVLSFALFNPKWFSEKTWMQVMAQDFITLCSFSKDCFWSASSFFARTQAWFRH